MARPRVPAQFVTSAPNSNLLPQPLGHEVAVVGRSNVGKSSLLGRLLRAPSLVRTSRTPGRTQLLNVFSLGDAWSFVDCPGYGYAKLSLTARETLQRMVEDYLFGSRPLAGALLLLDARREAVSAHDRTAVAHMLDAGRQVLVLVTKIDLIPKPQRLAQASKVARSVGVPPDWAISCSSKSGEGIDEIWARLGELATAPEPDVG